LESKHRLGAQVQKFDEKVLKAGDVSRFEFACFELDTLFGTSDVNKFLLRMRKSLPKNDRSKRGWWKEQREILDELYWENLFGVLSDLKLRVTRQGIMPIAEVPSSRGKGTEWLVGDIQDCEVNVESCYRNEADRIVSPESRRALYRGRKPRKLLFLRTIMAKKAA
jgi:hypothetical protein